jgi:hypothetical protein
MREWCTGRTEDAGGTRGASETGGLRLARFRTVLRARGTGSIPEAGCSSQHQGLRVELSLAGGDGVVGERVARSAHHKGAESQLADEDVKVVGEPSGVVMCYGVNPSQVYCFAECVDGDYGEQQLVQDHAFALGVAMMEPHGGRCCKQPPPYCGACSRKVDFERYVLASAAHCERTTQPTASQRRRWAGGVCLTSKYALLF